MTTGFSRLEDRPDAGQHLAAELPNSGPRWSIVGLRDGGQHRAAACWSARESAGSGGRAGSSSWILRQSACAPFARSAFCIDAFCSAAKVERRANRVSGGAMHRHERPRKAWRERSRAEVAGRDLGAGAPARRTRSRARCASTPSRAGATRPTPRSTRSCRRAWSSRRARPTSQAALAIAREHGVPVIARGGGTSQNGQPIGAGPRARLLAPPQRDPVDRRRGRRPRSCSRARARAPERAAQAATACSSPSSPRPRAAARSAAWPATIPAAPARSATARWSTTCSAMRALLPTASAIALGTARRQRCRDHRIEPGRDLADRMVALADRERDEIEAHVPEGAAPGRRLQSRRAAAGRSPNLAHLLVGSEGTLARHDRGHAEAVAAAGAPGDGRVPLPVVPVRDGDDAASRRARAGGGRARRQQRAGARRRHPAVPRARSPTSRRGSRTACCWSSSRATTSASLQARPAAARRLHGRSRLSGRGRRGGRAGAAALGLGRARGLPQHHDVDEGRRESRSPSSRIARCRWSTSPTTRTPITDLFARHGTRGTWYAHASVGCLHVRPILNMKDGGRRRARCGRSPRRPAISCAASRARIRASTATASRARSSTSGCSVRGSSRAFEEVKDALRPRATG